MKFSNIKVTKVLTQPIGKERTRKKKASPSPTMVFRPHPRAVIEHETVYEITGELNPTVKQFCDNNIIIGYKIDSNRIIVTFEEAKLFIEPKANNKKFYRLIYKGNIIINEIC